MKLATSSITMHFLFLLSSFYPYPVFPELTSYTPLLLRKATRHRSSQRGCRGCRFTPPRARMPNTFSEFAGFRSCNCTHYA